MKTKRKFLTITLFLLISFFKAQDKYDYLAIEYITNFKVIAISINGNEFKKEDIDRKHDKSGYNANPLLEKVMEYEAKGWEVVTLNLNHMGNAGLEVYYSFMRKKKTN